VTLNTLVTEFGLVPPQPVEVPPVNIEDLTPTPGQ
jgi:hypothetical protein